MSQTPDLGSEIDQIHLKVEIKDENELEKKEVDRSEVENEFIRREIEKFVREKTAEAEKTKMVSKETAIFDIKKENSETDPLSLDSGFESIEI